jgi:hypothetical protein
MAIKNLFGRGIGFGAPTWIVTRGYSIDAAVAIPFGLRPFRLDDRSTHMTLEARSTHTDLDARSTHTTLALQE